MFISNKINSKNIIGRWGFIQASTLKIVHTNRKFAVLNSIFIEIINGSTTTQDLQMKVAEYLVL